MCGIFGCITQTFPVDLEDRLGRVKKTLHHRGPDSSGAWYAPDPAVALAHTRLSILELSEAGNQPMHSCNDRYVISYNGEIYNHMEIRQQLTQLDANIRFAGNSDTSTLLEACAHWGVEAAVNKVIGMFAFGIWDKHANTLTLVRDRMGIKPLYWGRQGNTFMFGSELKAFSAYQDFRPQIDRDALAAFMQSSYVPAPRTIYKNIYKLPPGCILTIKHGGEADVRHYWRVEDAIQRGIAQRHTINETDFLHQYETLLSDAVRQRLISDVPLGAFLSGGVDSSTVVALMQANSTRPVRTYSIGFHEKNYNEAGHAAAIAGLIGTEHTEFFVSEKDVLDCISDLPAIYDEPFADSSQIPNYLVAKLARRDVTVALTGDGGDEINAGYNRYLFAHKYYPLSRYLPHAVSGCVRNLIGLGTTKFWDGLSSVLPGRMRAPQTGDKLYKLGSILGLAPDDAYRELVSVWPQTENVVKNNSFSWHIPGDREFLTDLNEIMDRMQYLDTVSYLPDDILTKVDRASMAVSLEARVPLLDHRLVELAWQAPANMKVRGGKGKWLLRRVLDKTVPGALVNRPKMGFSLPVDEWLKGELRDWSEDLIDKKKLNDQGFLCSDMVHEKWRQHLAGTHNWYRQLWNVLMFQSWYERWSV